MDIDWKRPFELAFEIGMFALGWLLIIIVVSIAVILAGALLKSFFVALIKQTRYRPQSKKPRKEEEKSPKRLLRPVKDEPDLRT